MITAVKRNNNNSQVSLSKHAIEQRVISLSSKYGIHQQKLATLMNIQLSTSTSSSTSSTIKQKVRKLKPL